MLAYLFDRDGRHAEPPKPPSPRPRRGAVLAVEACGLCRTDLTFSTVTWCHLGPDVLGHQVVGKVVGAGAGVSRLDGLSLRRALLGETCGTCTVCTSDGEPALPLASPASTATAVRPSG
jgi:D-arabinose 1-dehydrogenase-like Zn-dependent alcohol dehydrogenase